MTYSFNTTPYEELTTADKKRYHRLQIKDRLAEIKSAFSGVLAAREELKKQKIRLSTSSDQFTADYIYQLLQREQTTANNAYLSHYNKAARALDQMNQVVETSHKLIDLMDPRLAAAIEIIRAAGTKLTHETAARLVNEFSGDQPALVILQEVLKGVSDSVDGGVDKMIYEPMTAFRNAGEAIRDHMLSEDGSLNRAARSISFIAQREGCEFPEVFDPEEVDRAARRAAGLVTGS